MRLASLALLLVLAVLFDGYGKRIPNALVLAGTVNGLAWALLPTQGPGFIGSLEGFGTGLALLLPMYALGAVAAGDVKLLAMLGTFLGPLNLVIAALFSFIAGGVLAVAVAARSGVLRLMFRNIGQVVAGSVASLAAGTLPAASVAAPAARMPYAVAIATGTAAFFLWLRLAA